MCNIKKLHPAAKLPTFGSEGAAGMDLYSTENVILFPGERKLVGTGIAVALPFGTEGQIRPRSGLAYKHGVTVLNAPGTIDCDYRGEVKVLLVNLGDTAFEVAIGDRIAQMVIGVYAIPEWQEVDDLDDSDRGMGGFGSTGY